jgi:hypothetical protein
MADVVDLTADSDTDDEAASNKRQRVEIDLTTAVEDLVVVVEVVEKKPKEPPWGAKKGTPRIMAELRHIRDNWEGNPTVFDAETVNDKAVRKQGLLRMMLV